MPAEESIEMPGWKEQRVVLADNSRDLLTAHGKKPMTQRRVNYSLVQLV